MDKGDVAPRESGMAPAGSHDDRQRDTSPADPEPIHFSTNIYAAPFGRYEVPAPTEPPANEILVGRERERARVTDWLLTMARSGALLVTGHRGVGKSQFVDFCVREFEQDVYKRYLRSTIGRVFFWDIGLTIGLMLVALFTPLLLSNVLEIYYARVPTPADRSSPVWGLLIAMPVMLLCAYPLVYARRTINIACELVSFGRSEGSSRLNRLVWGFAWGGSVLACLGAWAFGPFKDPCVGLACLIVLAAWVYAVIHALSIRAGKWPLTAGPSDASAVDVTDRSWQERAVVPLALVVGSLWLIRPTWKFPTDHWATTGHYLLSLPWVFGAGFTMRAIDARRLHLFLKSGGAVSPELQALRIKRAGGSRVGYVALASVLFAAATVTLVLWQSPEQLAALQCAAALMGLGVLRRFYLQKKLDSSPFVYLLRPRGRYVLCCKALFCFVFALQLLTPVIVWLSFRSRSCLYALGGAIRAACERLLTGSSAWPTNWDVLPDLSLMQQHLAPLVSADPELRPEWLTIWNSGADEGAWLLLAGIFATQIIWLEYSWIIRRLERDRLESAYAPNHAEMVHEWHALNEHLDPPAYGVETSPDLGTRFERLKQARELARATLFWLMLETWLPVLRVRINLGFDALSHTRVIEAMLAGLRESYYHTFISWRSRVGLGARGIQLALALILAVALGDRLIRPNVGLLPKSLQADASLIVIKDSRHDIADRALLTLLPYELSPPGPARIVFRTYHILLFLVLLVLGGRIARSVGFHRTIHRHLQDLTHRLSSTVRESRAGRAPVQFGGIQVVSQGDSREVSSAPQDPRAVEYAFHQMLQRIVQPYLQLPIRGHVLSLPAPEVVFIFDELDKIGSRSVGAGQAGPNEIALESTRIQQLHALFADMKNLLSIAPARFIFVGGRNLHDEWLADQTQLRPLLSSIFDVEVYLPTLLCDPVVVSDNDEPDPARGTRAFVNAQLARVNTLFERWERDKRLYERFLPPEVAHLFYVQQPHVDERKLDDATSKELTPWTLWQSGPRPAIQPSWSADFTARWVHYLAFRSRGVPRALHELVEGFVRATGRVVDRLDERFKYFDCQHVVFFSDIDRYRVQFAASLYRKLCGTPEEHNLSRSMAAQQLIRRRDETVQTAFYLADVIFKFHSRAFSWSNLERIDELANVHAPPGLRQLLERVVRAFTETHITQTLNGIYDFRFRSETEAEIRYLSRNSPKEMAALNFTLDESQALRQHYLQRLAAADPGSHARYELEAAVGELYDFDERYDHARAHYEGAIRALDARLRAAHGPDNDKKGILSHVLDSSTASDGRNLGRRQVQWGLARLRLMLQIGMTYERTRNYEQALVEYRDARTLSRALWIGMLDDRGRGDPGADGDSSRHRLDTLKHVPIVYQALFATAWLAEKTSNAVGTSTMLLEQGLWDLRTRLPSVRDEDVKRARNPADAGHPAFFLSMADLHQATAQLYFFKGTHHPRKGVRQGETPLDLAEYHYLVSLHEVRRAMRHERLSAPTPVAPISSQPVELPAWPDTVARRLAATLFGLAETWLARVELRDHLEDATGARWRTGPVPEFGAFVHWMQEDSRSRAFEFSHWLGVWAKSEIPQPRSRMQPSAAAAKPAAAPKPAAGERGWLWLLKGSKEREPLGPGPNELVRAYVVFASLGVEVLAHANHRSEAARESIRLAAGLENVLCCLRTLAWLDDAEAPRDQPAATWLTTMALRALVRAGELLLETTGQSEDFGSRDIDKVYAHARTVAIALGLHAVQLNCRDANGILLAEQIGDLVRRWPSFEGQAQFESSTRAGFRTRLCENLDWQVFPMLNRLGALRVLVIDAALADPIDLRRSHEHMLELGRQHAAYDSPFHFTPFHYGVAAALWALRLKRESHRGFPAVAGSVYEAPEMAAHALRALHCSLGMLSSGATYHERLGDMYYLDGDFADRCIQTRHAQQLAGRGLTVELIRRLEDRLQIADPLARLSAPPVFKPAAGAGGE